jgi:hypothetical protein
MCFVDYGDGESVWRTGPKLVTARKEHDCDDCHGKVAKGEQHEYGTYIFDRSYHSVRRCARCIRIEAAIYKREIAEGCREWESHAPYGSRAIADYLADRSLAWDDAAGAIVAAPETPC